MEKRFGVVSADGHCRLMHLPFDLWSKRLPRRFQDDGRGSPPGRTVAGNGSSRAAPGVASAGKASVAAR